MRTKVSYKDLKAHLEKEWSLEWYKSQSDFGTGIYLKNIMKISKNIII